MTVGFQSVVLLALAGCGALVQADAIAADECAEPPTEVRGWSGQITLPTYPWEEDRNPKFWALEGGTRLSTTVREPIMYPYVMQDHLSRAKIDRTYRALFLENEYLRVTCLPELGGRLYSVFDKSTGQDMFHTSSVIKPGMIAMRGAWISGGVEWNAGPHGHTVTAVSPVSATLGRGEDGSAYLEIANVEQIFRTRWTVRVTLRPGRAYLDEQIRLENPTDGMHPYYFWNCTAFPNRPGTRFIYPMSLGTDHNFREFFTWPIHEGRDLTWLKNYETYASVFAVDCAYDFFGAYDVDADRGIVQVANHNVLRGKKAWTWGQWDFGQVAQRNLTDTDGPYIEVQSGPLPTQSDYGLLVPHAQVNWQEYWYPVHGLGDGFEFANENVAIQTASVDERLELRLLATAKYDGAICELASGERILERRAVNLSPAASVVVALTSAARPVKVTIASAAGDLLAEFVTPLPIPQVDPPTTTPLADRPDDKASVEELYLKGRAFDRATNRRQARAYYERALDRDPGHVASLRGLAVLDFEAGQYDQAVERARRALDRDNDDGQSWYCLGASLLRQGHFVEAAQAGYRAAECGDSVPAGYDLAGRATMRLGERQRAIELFAQAAATDARDSVAVDHLLIARYAARAAEAAAAAQARARENPTAATALALAWLVSGESASALGRRVHEVLGEPEFEMLEASLAFAELGLFDDAARIVQAACVDAPPADGCSGLPFYYLAWYASQGGDDATARTWLERAARTHRERVFASRPEEVAILRYATTQNPTDAQAYLQLGCLLANLGRTDEAGAAWRKVVELDPRAGIAWRNLALIAAAGEDWETAETQLRKAIAAEPDDQTRYRDLAEILLVRNRRPDAIELLETMPVAGTRRAEITVMLAQAYVDEQRYEDCIRLLETTPYFVNWEGQDVTWRLFNRSHIERGRQRLKQNDAAGALADFEAALTYPTNLNVGRSNKPVEAPAQYWRGQALAALGRTADARAAWQAGADGANVAGEQNQYRDKCRQALDR